MKSLILSFAAAVAANPVGSASSSLQSRQSIANTASPPAGGAALLPPGAADTMGDDLQILLKGGPKLAEMIGSREGNDKLIKFAGMLGAKRGSGGGLGMVMSGEVNGKYGKVAAPAGSKLETRVELPAREKTPNSKSVKIRYGPYLIPNMGHTNRMMEEGMLSNAPDLNVAKPCDECAIIGMQAGLEFPDGKNANIDQGLWLHHFVLFNEGKGREDATCADQDISLPHVGVSTAPQNAERLFSSGNERVPFSIPKAGLQEAGYMMQKDDKFHLIVDLMNQNMQDAIAYLTITYDYVPGRPQGWADVKPIWFDVMQCGTSEVNAPKDNAFVLEYTWNSNLKGKAISAAGHVHDGGLKTELYKDDKLVCTSEAKYGGSPEFIEKRPPMGKHARRQEGSHGHGANSATVHISEMTNCSNNSFIDKEVAPGQKWKLKAYYDFDKNKGMMHADGSKDHVMGISIMFVKKE